MKAALRHEQFLTDADGNRIGVVLDLKRYERLREAAEELEDIRAYEEARPRAYAELAAGKFKYLDEVRPKQKKN
jgi:hypothetical protein